METSLWWLSRDHRYRDLRKRRMGVRREKILQHGRQDWETYFTWRRWKQVASLINPTYAGLIVPWWLDLELTKSYVSGWVCESNSRKDQLRAGDQPPSSESAALGVKRSREKVELCCLACLCSSLLSVLPLLLPSLWPLSSFVPTSFFSLPSWTKDQESFVPSVPRLGLLSSPTEELPGSQSSAILFL